MLTANYHFNVSGLWVKAELLGSEETITSSGHTLKLILPADEMSFGVDPKNFSLRTLGGFTRRVDDDSLIAREVLMVRVEVSIEESLSAEQFSSGNPSDKIEAQETGFRILRDAATVAREFVQQYLALTRTQLGQYWLGPSEFPVRMTWTSELLDSEGNKIPLGINDSLHAEMRLTELAISAEDHARIISQVTEGVQPQLAETFLSDARYTAYNFEHANLRQAVLLAAIACEIKVKEVITTLASSEQAPLVSLLLENPRDWSMGAATLFDKGMNAVCGRSLRDENRNLYKEIDLLFQDRNKIAHKGGSGLSTDDMLLKHISSADSVFQWLNGITTDGSETEQAETVADPGK